MTGTPPELADRTTRDLEVLRLIADACSNAEVAADLFFTEATVKPHVNHILTKPRLRDRAPSRRPRLPYWTHRRHSLTEANAFTRVTRDAFAVAWGAMRTPVWTALVWESC